MNLKIISVISAAVILMTQITACTALGSTTSRTKQTSTLPSIMQTSRASNTEQSATKTTDGNLNPSALSGVLICDVSNEGSYYTDASKTKTYIRMVIRIIQIDPVSGATKIVREFSNQKSHSAIDLPRYGSVLLYRQIFNSSYDKLAATIGIDRDGSRHVGWINANGVFTDVSGKITSANGDFSGVVLHYYPQFGPNDYLYYYDARKAGGLYISDMDAAIKRVPSSNPTAGAVELMDDSVSNNTYLIHPDGSAHDSGSNFRFYSDSTMQYCARWDIYDWINRTTYIGQYYQQKDQIYTFTAQDAKSFDPTKFLKMRPLLPDIPNRVNFNGVVSPDGSQVAFLSYLSTGSESPSLFVVSSSGGDPRKVPTDYKFDFRKDASIQLIDWK